MTAYRQAAEYVSDFGQGQQCKSTTSRKGHLRIRNKGETQITAIVTHNRLQPGADEFIATNCVSHKCLPAPYLKGDLTYRNARPQTQSELDLSARTSLSL